MDKDKLFAAWLEQNKLLEKVEKALEVTKVKRQALAKQCFEASGKGPHEVDGRSYLILNRGETYFFKASQAASEGSSSGGSGNPEKLDALVAVVTEPAGIASSEIAKRMGCEVGPKLSDLIKSALGSGRITKTGERSKTKYHPAQPS
jgi:hypothetical protein